MLEVFDRLEFDPPTQESWDALPMAVKYRLLVGPDGLKWRAMARELGIRPIIDADPLWEDPRG
jgi:hypothetical protein